MRLLAKLTVSVPLDMIPYVDYPELRINKNESTEMPFRYVKGKDGQLIMPDVGHALRHVTLEDRY